MLIATTEKWADRLIELVVPKMSVAACACGDSYCTSICCHWDAPGGNCNGYFRVWTNCACQTIRDSCQC